MKSIVLLANPKSGQGEAEEVERELRDLGADVTRFPIQDAEEARGAGADRIVVAGGDGSLGLAASVAAEAEVPLGVVPVGTANDFARAFGLPDDLSAAVRLAAQGSRKKRVELGRMGPEGRPFVNVASLGLPPEAAKRAGGLKRYLGPLAYAVGGFRAAFGASPVTCRVVDADGQELFSGEAWQATVACSGHFGGGSQVEADPTDGMLDAVAVEAGSRLKLGLRAHGMRSGTLEEQSGVRKRRSRAFTIEVGADTPFNVDGEICARSGEVPFRVDPNAFEVVVG
jgi:diacylglycerol kinase (ATP)